MKKTDYSELESEFGQRRDDLGALYEPSATSPEEGEFPCPILESVRRETAHYSNPEMLCVGGEKRIFKVRDLRTDRVVAMARPLEDASRLDQERFFREARLTSCLQHPNIVSVYDLGMDKDGSPFFTMEFVRGDTLKEVVEKFDAGDEETLQRFPLSRLLELFSKICDGLAYAHARGVVHLDVKPANIKVGSFGEGILCDWGLASVLQPAPGIMTDENVPVDELPDGDILNDFTLRGVVKGTPGFMAPEQASNKRNISRQTDVYSLGALLFYILTRQLPVEGKSHREQIKNTRDGKIRTLEEAAPDRFIPPGLAAVVRKALAMNPADRYESVSKLRDDVNRYLTGFAPTAQHAGWIEQFVLLVKRRQIAFKVAMVSFVLLLILGVVSFIRVVGEKDAADIARIEALENLRLYKEETDVSRALTDSIRATALDFINDEDFLNAPGKIEAIESHLQQETDPENRQVLLEYLALLHFVVQDFRQAGECFDQISVSQRYEACRDLATQYGENKSDDDWLSANEMVALLNTLKRHIRNVAYYMAYYYFSEHPRMSAEELLPVVEVMLDTLNNLSYTEKSMSRLELSSNDQGLLLSLSGEPYSVFIMPIPVPIRQANVLRPLKLHSLDLSHSGLTDLERVRGMLVDELNIAGMKRLPLYKFYVFDRIKVKRVYHTLNHSDKYLKKKAPHIEFVRVDE